MFRWLFGKSDFYRFHDAFALTQDEVLRSLVEALKACQAKGETVLLLSHFQDSFEAIQGYLEQADVTFEIVTESINAEQVKRISQKSTLPIFVSMAQLLARHDRKLPREESPKIALVVGERHPLPQHDNEIVKWARWLPFPVQLGYFVALDSPLYRPMMNDQVRMVIEQLGKQNELITGAMISRRVNSFLKRNASRVLNEKKAKSAEEWLRINGCD